MVVRGSYCLCIKVGENTDVAVGSMGVIHFHRGSYVYVGSALNSLLPRLRRHLSTNRGEGKSIHWHIDYLLRQPAVDIVAIYATDWAVRMECEIAAKVAERGQLVPRFGCSDCGCQSHLYMVDSFGFLGKIGLKRMDLGELFTSS